MYVAFLCTTIISHPHSISLLTDYKDFLTARQKKRHGSVEPSESRGFRTGCLLSMPWDFVLAAYWRVALATHDFIEVQNAFGHHGQSNCPFHRTGCLLPTMIVSWGTRRTMRCWIVMDFRTDCSLSEDDCCPQGHIFCRRCIDDQFAANMMQCATYRAGVGPNTLHSVRSMDRLIGGLKVLDSDGLSYRLLTVGRWLCGQRCNTISVNSGISLSMLKMNFM